MSESRRTPRYKRVVQYTRHCIDPLKAYSVRLIRTDGVNPLRSVEYSSRIVYCISLGGLRKNKLRFVIVTGAEGLTIRSIRADGKAALTLRKVQFTDRRLHLIRET